jgi:hypothetical protein
MVNWATGNKYLTSGSLLMVLGTSVTLLLSNIHVISHLQASALILFMIATGIAQHF